MSIPDVGDAAPDFPLPGMQLIDGEVVRRVLPVGRRRIAVDAGVLPVRRVSRLHRPALRATRRSSRASTSLGADVWGISLQGLNSHEKFARNRSLCTFPLLADEQGKAVSAYGYDLHESACAGRCSSSTPRVSCAGSTSRTSARVPRAQPAGAAREDVAEIFAA